MQLRSDRSSKKSRLIIYPIILTCDNIYRDFIERQGAIERCYCQAEPVAALMRLSALAKGCLSPAKGARMSALSPDPDRLTALDRFMTDPGSLRADTYIPKKFPKNGPLVVVLHGSARTMVQAMFRMKGYGGPSDRRLGALVRGASKSTGPWPTISVWHGSSDMTVDSSNADSVVRQWQKIHKVEGPPTRVETVDDFPRQVWCNSDGREVTEEYIIDRMGHGTPISAKGSEGLGKEGRYMPEVGISSTRRIADFWGLTS